MELALHLRSGFFALALALPSAALSQDIQSSSALGGEVFVSTDSDDTTIVRTAVDFDLRNAGQANRLGIRLEHAWYELRGQPTEERDRIFVQIADRAQGWNWAARVGTDGSSIIGSISANDNARFRKEIFVERDVVETPIGLDRGIYSTFAGAAIDLPVDDRNIFTALVGAQEFTGDNWRLHLRGNYVHVVDPELGLSAQIRALYSRNSVPREFDYYSPRYFAQVLPVVQIRRFVDGWQLLAAGGIGIQQDSETDWRQANFAQLRITSPERGQWSVSGEAIFSQTPGSSAVIGPGYDYFQSRLLISRRF